jgi:AraC-like DNA-binding protein
VLPGIVRRSSIIPSASTASAISALLAFEWDQDSPGVMIPHPENHFIVRAGPLVPRGLEVHAFGAREKVHRKLIRSGHWTVTARIRLGTSHAVLGVPASEIAGRVVALDDLWGDAAARRLCARLAEARDSSGAAIILENAIAERVACAPERPANVRLALAAADKLAGAHVNAVARDLGVSERHLRRVFHEIIGVGPKVFTKLVRFHHALWAARAEARPSWANIAAAAGYYDQAHLIADFRSIAGATPRAFVGELRAARAVS